MAPPTAVPAPGIMLPIAAPPIAPNFAPAKPPARLPPMPAAVRPLLSELAKSYAPIAKVKGRNALPPTLDNKPPNLLAPFPRTPNPLEIPLPTLPNLPPPVVLGGTVPTPPPLPEVFPLPPPPGP